MNNTPDNGTPQDAHNTVHDDSNNPFESTPASHQGIQRLITHAWNIIFKESRIKGRLSRGEYWISILLLGVLSGAVSLILGQFGPIGNVLGIIVGSISSIRGLGLIIRRSHDLDKSGWYYFLPGIVLMIIGILYLISTFIIPEPARYILNRVLGIGTLAIIIRLMIIGLRIIGSPGTSGPNQYGEDKIPSQPQGNGLYWLTGIGLVIISTLLSVFNPTQQSEYSIEQMIRQRIDTMPSNDIVSPLSDLE